MLPAFCLIINAGLYHALSQVFYCSAVRGNTKLQKKLQKIIGSGYNTVLNLKEAWQSG